MDFMSISLSTTRVNVQWRPNQVGSIGQTIPQCDHPQDPDNHGSGCPKSDEPGITPSLYGSRPDPEIGFCLRPGMKQ